MSAMLSIRSYRDPGALHAHPHVQVVLPLEGALDIEIGRRGARLSCGLCAFVAPGARHTQEGRVANRSLVLDAPETAFSEAILDRLGRETFFAPSPEIRHLMGFAGLRFAGRDGSGTEDRAALARLLTGTLGHLQTKPGPLDRLRTALRRDPAAAWTVSGMASEIGVSRSVLYRLLSGTGDATPARLLSRIRLEAACGLLAGTPLPLAEIALRCGFSDQSALTRALRRETGRTPAAWRRASGTPGQ